MKDISILLYFLMFSFSICNEGIKTVEDKTVTTTKMEVHANELFTITMTNRKGIHHFWRLANQEELNKTTIQFVTTLEDRKKIVDIRQEMALYQLTITSSLK